MNNFTQNDIKSLFSGLCCARCKNDFTMESIKVLDNNSDEMICNLSCNRCGKDFGQILFNFNRKSKNHFPLEVVEGPPVINYDDVIDAHNFIKNMM